MSLEKPRAGKGSAGFGAGSAGTGELWGLSWAGAGCVPCRINPFLTHSQCCRQGLEQLMVQRHWKGWGEGEVRAWAGVGRVPSTHRPHVGWSTNLPHIPESRNGWSFSAP